MKKIKKDIAALDDTEYKPEKEENNRSIISEGGKLFWKRGKNKPKSEVSLGEVMTDGEWGIDYFLDPESVPRNIRKRYFIEKAKRELQERLDTQIMIDEISSRQTGPLRTKAYEELLQMRESGKLTEGHIAKKIIQNFLKKMVFDFEADFNIYAADAYQDVEQKVDFVIHRKKHYRGVGVEADEKAKDIGVQFTISAKPFYLRKKSEQIRKAKERLENDNYVEDIILVTMPLQGVKKIYQKWRETKMPGGPDKLLETETKKDLLRKVMPKMFSPEEIEEQIEKISF